MTDTANWYQVHQLYQAKGGERYITIGNFKDNAHTTVLPFQPGAVNANYYVDDVSVVPVHVIKPYLGNDTSICKNSLPLPLHAPPGYQQYLWNTGNTTDHIFIQDSGTYIVRCILPGCGELTDTIHVSFIEEPTLQLPSDTVICKGNQMIIQAQPGFISYLWNTGQTSPSILVDTAGIYILQAQDLCRIQTDSVEIKLDSLPDIVLSIGEDTTLCDGMVNSPIVLSSNHVLPNYQWNTGDLGAELLVAEGGWYWLASHFYCGSVKSDSVFVDVCPPDYEFQIYFPNTFTPNGDDINDVFEIKYTNVTIESFSIFNRWGNQVYNSIGASIWDGKTGNSVCQSGIYSFLIIYVDPSNKRRQEVGKVFLIK